MSCDGLVPSGSTGRLWFHRKRCSSGSLPLMTARTLLPPVYSPGRRSPTRLHPATHRRMRRDRFPLRATPRTRRSSRPVGVTRPPISTWRKPGSPSRSSGNHDHPIGERSRDDRSPGSVIGVIHQASPLGASSLSVPQGAPVPVAEPDGSYGTTIVRSQHGSGDALRRHRW